MTEAKKLTPEEYDRLPWLHIYAQYIWHDEARIVGTREALLALREAIDQALAHPNGEAETQAFTADGEGYAIEVRRVPRRSVQNMRRPYTASYAGGRSGS